MTEKEKVKLILKNRALIFAINGINLICFTLLAIVFKKWWLIFFSTLFWYYTKTKED